MAPNTSLLSTAFGPEQAATYDDRFSKLNAIKDTMHLILRTHFQHLPETARILVAGAGTGAEVRFLAGLFPNWRFALADPAAAMLDIARRHAEAEGFADRCVFHSDYVSTLDESGVDAATSLLVSHFLTDAAGREAYFRSIAERLAPGARLFNADLCADASSPDFPALMNVWLDLMSHAGMAEEGREHYRAAFGRDFAAHGPAEVESMIGAAGFGHPVQCFQAGLIRGWVTRRA